MPPIVGLELLENRVRLTKFSRYLEPHSTVPTYESSATAFACSSLLPDEFKGTTVCCGRPEFAEPAPVVALPFPHGPWADLVRLPALPGPVQAAPPRLPRPRPGLSTLRRTADPRRLRLRRNLPWQPEGRGRSAVGAALLSCTGRPPGDAARGFGDRFKR